MKSERRHELETNDLADWLGHASTTVQPYFKTVLAAVLLLIAVLVGRSMLASSSQRQNNESWSAFFASRTLQSADAMRDVAKQFPRAKATPWALQLAGEFGLREGIEKLLIDRDKAKEILKQSADDYSLAIQKATDQAVQKRASLGLAQVYETLGDFEQATTQYQKVVANWPGDPIADLAQRRADFIARKDTLAFADWFKEQKIDPTPPPATNDLNVKPPESSAVSEDAKPSDSAAAATDVTPAPEATTEPEKNPELPPQAATEPAAESPDATLSDMPADAEAGKQP